MVWAAKLLGFVGGKSNAIMYLFIAVVVGGTLIYINFLRSDNQELREDKTELLEVNAVLTDKLDDAVKLNKENAKQFDMFVEDTNKTYIALTNFHEGNLKRAVAYAVKQEEIRNVKKENDGSVAPVLYDAFSWMQQRESATTKDSREDQNSKAKDTK